MSALSVISDDETGSGHGNTLHLSHVFTVLPAVTAYSYNNILHVLLAPVHIMCGRVKPWFVKRFGSERFGVQSLGISELSDVSHCKKAIFLAWESMLTRNMIMTFNMNFTQHLSADCVYFIALLPTELLPLSSPLAGRVIGMHAYSFPVSTLPFQTKAPCPRDDMMIEFFLIHDALSLVHDQN